MAYLIEYLEKLRDISHVKYSAQSFEYNKHWNLGYNNNNYYINFTFIILLLILLLLLFPSVDDFLLGLFFFFFNIIYLFIYIFGCVGSSFLCEGFL